jgi:hypothetical protein
VASRCPAGRGAGRRLLIRFLITAVALTVAVTVVFNGSAHLDGGPPRIIERQPNPPLAVVSHPA